jgi:hypothetical protein
LVATKEEKLKLHLRDEEKRTEALTINCLKIYALEPLRGILFSYGKGEYD